MDWGALLIWAPIAVAAAAIYVVFVGLPLVGKSSAVGDDRNRTLLTTLVVPLAAIFAVFVVLVVLTGESH